MLISAYFADYGTPKTGLSPVVYVRDLSDGSLAVDGEAMTEVGAGFYKYEFSGYSASGSYGITCDGGAALTAGERYAVGAKGPGEVFAAYFASDGSPTTGLSPTIKIYDVTDGSLLVDGEAMTEAGNGWYYYEYEDFNASKNYAVLCDGGVTLDAAERYVAGASDLDRYYTTASLTFDAADDSVTGDIEEDEITVDVEE